MSMLTIELAGSTTRTQTALPDDVVIEHLLPSMITLVGDGCPAEGRWRAYRNGGVRLSPTTTLGHQGVTAGETLFVTRASYATDPHLPDPPPMSPDELAPSERARRILPERLSTRHRFADTARALVGTRVTPEAIDGTPIERVTDMWRWTDHGRRLSWMIGRPRLQRTITIGIVTQAEAGSSAHVAVDVARALGSSRTDRVILVDGDPIRAGVTRLAGAGMPTVASVADGSHDLDARFGADEMVTVLGCDLACVASTGFDVYRRLLDRVRPDAGVVVVDCGPVGSSRLPDLCEQVVLVTDRTIDSGVARTFRNRPTVVAIVPRGEPVDAKEVDVTLPSALGSLHLGDSLAAHEVAAVLAHGWARLGATA